MHLIMKRHSIVLLEKYRKQKIARNDTPFLVIVQYSKVKLQVGVWMEIEIGYLMDTMKPTVTITFYLLFLESVLLDVALNALLPFEEELDPLEEGRGDGGWRLS